jgi:hypothetical protein
LGHFMLCLREHQANVDHYRHQAGICRLAIRVRVLVLSYKPLHTEDAPGRSTSRIIIASATCVSSIGCPGESRSVGTRGARVAKTQIMDHELWMVKNLAPQFTSHNSRSTTMHAGALI